MLPTTGGPTPEPGTSSLRQSGATLFLLADLCFSKGDSVPHCPLNTHNRAVVLWDGLMLSRAQECLLSSSCLPSLAESQCPGVFSALSLKKAKGHISCIPVQITRDCPSSERPAPQSLSHTPHASGFLNTLCGIKCHTESTRYHHIYYLVLSLKLCAVGMISHILTVSHLGEARSRAEVHKLFCSKEWDGVSPRPPVLFALSSLKPRSNEGAPEPVLAQARSPQQL